jgi:Fe-S-cluster containining protein
MNNRIDIARSTIEAWQRAADDSAIAAELEAVYAMVADQIEARGPACWASGRCCNFDAAGHRLYVTGLEAAYTVARLEPSQALTQEALDAARACGGCPFQQANLCGVHSIKPMGCRVYFCDESAQQWQHDVSERAMAMIRSIHERHGVEYVYAEWRALLGALIVRPDA